MKKKLALILTLSLVFSMMPSQASAALKSAGTPTKVQTLVSSEKLEHNFVNITADGQTLHIEAETPVKSTEYNISVRQSGKNSSVWPAHTDRLTWEATAAFLSICRITRGLMEP